MKFHINKNMLKEAAAETKDVTTNTPGYIEIIYNMITGGVWAHYYPSYENWRNVDSETEIKILTKKEYSAEKLAARIRNEIRTIQKNLKNNDLGMKTRLPEKWVYLINNFEL